MPSRRLGFTAPDRQYVKVFDIVEFNVPPDTVYISESDTRHISSFLSRGALSSDVHLSFSNRGPATTALTRVAFVYNGPKGMELAPNSRYSGGS